MKFIKMEFDPLLLLEEPKRNEGFLDEAEEKIEATGYSQMPTFDDYGIKENKLELKRKL